MRPMLCLDCNDETWSMKRGRATFGLFCKYRGYLCAPENLRVSNSSKCIIINKCRIAKTQIPLNGLRRGIPHLAAGAYGGLVDAAAVHVDVHAHAAALALEIGSAAQ